MQDRLVELFQHAKQLLVTDKGETRWITGRMSAGKDMGTVLPLSSAAKHYDLTGALNKAAFDLDVDVPTYQMAKSYLEEIIYPFDLVRFNDRCQTVNTVLQVLDYGAAHVQEKENLFNMNTHILSCLRLDSQHRSC